jgi:hypothetical protein
VTTDQPHRFRARFAALLATLLVVPALLLAAAPPAGAASSNTLTVKAGEYTYQVSGSPKSGWTQINFQNDGTEYHMLVIASLKPGVTLKQVKAAVTSEDQSAFDPLAGKGQVVSTPTLLGPGEQTTVIAKLPAGHYALMCFIPAPDGQSHAAHGMVKILDVSSAKSGLTPPKDGLVPVTITDDAVTVPSSGVPGHGWAKITNGGSVTRDLTLARFLSPSATFEEGTAYFNQFFQSGKLPDGPAPAALAGGVTGIPAGGTGYFQLNLKPGRFVFISDTEDDQDGSANVHTEFTVK